MDSNTRSDIWLAVLLFLICLLYSLPSLALRQLDAFVASARAQNADALEARATADEQRAEADASLGKRLPGVALTASPLAASVATSGTGALASATVTRAPATAQARFSASSSGRERLDGQA